MTEKRFTGHYNEFLTWFEDNGEKMTHIQIVQTLNELNDENEQLKQELFEVKKDYLIETADISDKIYLDDMIEELRREMIVKDGGRLI